MSEETLQGNERVWVDSCLGLLGRRALGCRLLGRCRLLGWCLLGGRLGGSGGLGLGHATGLGLAENRKVLLGESRCGSGGLAGLAGVGLGLCGGGGLLRSSGLSGASLLGRGSLGLLL